ncbi:hypothetical protein B0H13DRAFT_2326922 [Mycena leptocephala]|nr:hypothetical protein B0H13DRAFT_2326922 [Mycena leptocephala]
MDIKDCGIKTPAEHSIRHSNISVGKGVTGKSAIPYETAQCSARTEFPVLASPRPFSCFYAALHHHTSICTRWLLDFRRAIHARWHFHCALAFPPRDICPLAVSRMPAPARTSAARSPFPGFPHAHAHSHFRCALAVSRMPARCFPHARSLFPGFPHACSLIARPRPLAFPAHPLAVFRTPAHRFLVSCTPASRFLLRLVLPPLPRASSSASRFPSASPHLRFAEPGAERDKNWL